MTFFRQLRAVTALGLSTIPNRAGASLVVVIGMACAVGAMLSVLSLSTGFTSMLSKGRPDRAIVMSQGAQFEPASAISRTSVNLIADAPGVKKTAAGRPMATADMLSPLLVTKKSDGLNVMVEVRGLGPQGPAVQPEIRMIAGRIFQPGKFEVIVGKNAPTLYQGMNVGDRVDLPQGNWRIVGVFDSGGNMMSNSVLTDADTLGAALRQPTYRSVTVMLDKPAAFDGFRRALAQNPALSVEVVGEQAYQRRMGGPINGLFTGIAYVVGGIMGLGAMFGAFNTMYAAVSSRRVEIATLRALGFGGGAVMLSVLAESLVLAFIGAVIGAVFAWAAFSGNLQGMGSTAITLLVTPGMAVGGVIFACVLATLAGFFPALRAARQPIAMALRAT